MSSLSGQTYDDSSWIMRFILSYHNVNIITNSNTSLKPFLCYHDTLIENSEKENLSFTFEVKDKTRQHKIIVFIL